MVEIPDSGIERFIQSLAAQNGVEYVRTNGDNLSDAFARLSGDDVMLDETERLLLALQRGGVITSAEAFELFNRYLGEKE